MEKKSAMLDDFTGPKQRKLYMYPKLLTFSCTRNNRLSIKEYIVTYRNKKRNISYRIVMVPKTLGVGEFQPPTSYTMLRV